MTPPTRRHRAEAAFAKTLIRLLRRLRPETASNLGGAITRTLGPLLPVSRIADINLRHALPELTAHARKRIIRGVWDNLGRTVAELPHIAHLRENTPTGPGWTVEGAHHLQAQAEKGGSVLFVSGHIGNWEIMPPACAKYGLPFASFYRAADNPLIDRLIRDMRQTAIGQPVPLFPKGARGAREALHHIASGGRLGVLADQKMNDGIEARFFGHPAMTPSAAAAFSLKYNAPIIMGHIQRLGPARFKLVVEPPIDPTPTTNRQADILSLTQTLNNHMEAWIRARPESWLWLHRRWPKSIYKTTQARNKMI